MNSDILTSLLNYQQDSAKSLLNALAGTPKPLVAQQNIPLMNQVPSIPQLSLKEGLSSESSGTSIPYINSLNGIQLPLKLLDTFALLPTLMNQSSMQGSNPFNVCAQKGTATGTKPKEQQEVASNRGFLPYRVRQNQNAQNALTMLAEKLNSSFRQTPIIVHPINHATTSQTLQPEAQSGKKDEEQSQEQNKQPEQPEGEDNTTKEQAKPKARQPRKKVKKEVEEELLDAFDSDEDEESDQEDDKADTFRPSKHSYYLTKKQIKEKRVLPKRSHATLAQEAAPKNEEEIIDYLVGEVEKLTGYKGIDRTKVHTLYVKSESDADKAIVRLKRNMYYYKKLLKVD